MEYEYWRTIPSFPLYSASNYGRIRNDKTGRIMRMQVGTRGYLILTLRRDNRQVPQLVHRLVAEAFLGGLHPGLDVNHIDGDKTNNQLNNLQLLCLNCHSYTDNFGSRNRKNKKQLEISEDDFVKALKNSTSIRQALFSLNLSDAGGNYIRANELIKKYNISFPTEKKKYYCQKCRIELTSNSKHCIICNNILQRKCERPSREELKKLIRIMPFTKIGEKYGVSDNAIRKWCVAENLPKKVSEIKTYSDKEWELI